MLLIILFASCALMVFKGKSRTIGRIIAGISLSIFSLYYFSGFLIGTIFSMYATKVIIYSFTMSILSGILAYISFTNKTNLLKWKKHEKTT
jgi:hypothetical protein